MICPNCRTTCGEEDAFCFRCGVPLHKPPVKKGTHRVPILILVALSVLGIALFFLIPMSEPVSDTPWFHITEGTLYFNPDLYTGSSELTVPEQVNGQTVTAIGSSCFEDCDELTTVVLPDTVTSIGSYAFADCSSLRGIFIPSSVTDLYACAFRGCTALEAISLPGSLVSIADHAFDSCDKLAYIFFDGAHSQWTSLYDAHIGLYTHVYCTDGKFLQR